MSESILPDGYSTLTLTTGSRMWMGPEELAVHAFERGDDWEVRFIVNGQSRVEHLTGAELEPAAVAHCRELAGVTA